MTPGGKLYAAFLDYSRAFDILNRQILIGKLEDTLERKNQELKLVRICRATTASRYRISPPNSKEIQQTNGVL